MNIRTAMVFATVLVVFAMAKTGEPAVSQEAARHIRLLSDLLASSAQTFRAVARKVRPSVVHIRCKTAAAPDNDGDPKTAHDAGSSLGSGIIIDANGYILTSYHVVAYAQSIEVLLDDRREFPTQLISFDPETDLAMLHIEAKDLPFARLGDSDRCEVGDWVLAIGSPFGLDQTVTAGIISAKERELNDEADELYGSPGFIQTDAAINPGSSGGPLLNMAGEVVAITHATLGNRPGYYSGLAFATPINHTKGVLDSMKKGLGAPRGRLGVGLADINQDTAKAFTLPRIMGAQVTYVKRGSAAEEAGIQTGDVILGVAGVEISDKAHLRSVIASQPVEVDLPLQVYRSGARIDITLRLTPKRFIGKDPILGVAVVDLVKLVADNLGVSSPEGVLVMAVAPDSLGMKAGLRPGMVVTYVNGQPTPDCRRYTKAMETIIKNHVTSLELAVNVKGRMHTLLLDAQKAAATEEQR